MRDAERRDLARRLRRDMTDAERALWRELRGCRFEDAKCRRQVPVGPTTVNLACLHHRLVIEVDGGQHSGSERDKMRDAFLRQAGWRVLRFWNHEVLGNREGVLTVIRNVLSEAPSPGQR